MMETLEVIKIYPKLLETKNTINSLKQHAAIKQP